MPLLKHAIVSKGWWMCITGQQTDPMRSSTCCVYLTHLEEPLRKAQYPNNSPSEYQPPAMQMLLHACQIMSYTAPSLHACATAA